MAITGFVRNMNHIVLGTDDSRLAGVYLGLVGVGILLAINALANWLAWRHPRLVQHVAKAVVTPAMKFLLDRPTPDGPIPSRGHLPFFWANGKVPTCDTWKTLANNDFKDYRLKVFGMVTKPVELSLDDLRAAGKQNQITLHHCIQGWSGIAEWGGLALEELIKLVEPKPEARAVVIYSFGEGAEGGEFYDSLSLEDARHPQTLLAYEMNFKPLGDVTWRAIATACRKSTRFQDGQVDSRDRVCRQRRAVGQGEGGYNEDQEYFGELANI